MSARTGWKRRAMAGIDAFKRRGGRRRKMAMPIHMRQQASQRMEGEV